MRASFSAPGSRGTIGSGTTCSAPSGTSASSSVWVEATLSAGDVGAVRLGQQASIRSADLDHFPVPGGTLKRWAQDLIEAGVDTAGLLARRYLLESSGGDSPLSRLRNEIIGLLGRFRAGLADEIREGLVPADADALIFGYLDRLAEDRAKLLAAREARKTTPG